MPKNKIIITLGAFVALLPVLGFPTSWESVFEVLAGLAIIATSTWATVDKKLTQKAKARARQEERRQAERRKMEEVSLETPVENGSDINNSFA